MQTSRSSTPSLQEVHSTHSTKLLSSGPAQTQLQEEAPSKISSALTGRGSGSTFRRRASSKISSALIGRGSDSTSGYKLPSIWAKKRQTKMEVKKDGIFSCVTASRQQIRKHLRDIAKIRLERMQEKTEKILREKGIYDGPEKMVEDVYKEIIDGSSNYPIHQQAELLVEAGRIGVWEAQMANPHYISKEAATLWPRWGSVSPYLRFIELRERLAKEGSSRPISRNHPLDIDDLSMNQLSQLHVGCKQWVKDYKENGESHSLERKRLFDRAKELAKESHDMRTAIRYFSRMKLDFMVDKHFMMEVVVTHLRSFEEKVVKMEWCLERCEEHVRAHEEEKKKEKKKPEFAREFEEFMKELKFADEDIYVEEFSGENISRKKLTDELPWSGAWGAWVEEASHMFDEDDSDTSTWE